jgi:hypothetical protein
MTFCEGALASNEAVEDDDDIKSIFSQMQLEIKRVTIWSPF